MGLSRNRQQATLLAERIRQYQRQYPDRPVHLVAHSGGAGIAAMAMERLDPAQPDQRPRSCWRRPCRRSTTSPGPATRPATASTTSIAGTTSSTWASAHARSARSTGDSAWRLAKWGSSVPQGLDAAERGAVPHEAAPGRSGGKQWLHARHAGGHTRLGGSAVLSRVAQPDHPESSRRQAGQSAR